MSARTFVALELAAIAIAAIVFVATFRVRPPYLDFALAIAAVALIAFSARRSASLWTAGMHDRDALRSARGAWVASAAFTAVALMVLAGVGAFAGGSELLGANTTPFGERLTNWHIAIAIAAYLPWALLQQYIFQNYLLARLLHLVPLPAAIALTAVAFSSVHFPRWPVMVVVLIAGTVWSLIYFRWRTLSPLACSHAVLGPALHYWVFGHDLLERWLP